MPTEPQSQPLVSIIVPVYNAADHIARCIESIRRQTYRNLEIILLNDGSKDVSYAVCQSYAGIDRRIVVIDKNNSGVSATSNLGMQEAHGKYFQFVDADDFIQPYATTTTALNRQSACPKPCGIPWWSVCWTPSWIRSTGCRLSAF